MITLANEPRPGEQQLSAADEPATRLKRREVSEGGMKRIFARQLPLVNRSAPLLENVPVELPASDLPTRPSTAASDAARCLHVLESAVRSCDQIRSSGLDDTENQDISVWLDAFQIISLITDVCCPRLPALATVGEARACVWSGAAGPPTPIPRPDGMSHRHLVISGVISSVGLKPHQAIGNEWGFRRLVQPLARLSQRPAGA